MLTAAAVDGCKSKFENELNKCEPKFNELTPGSWEGTSFNALQGKVNGMVGEVKTISNQFTNLRTVAVIYASYKQKGEEYMVAEQKKANAEAQLTSGELNEQGMRDAQTAKEEAEGEMAECKQAMERLVAEAKRACAAGSQIKVKDVDFKPIDFV